MFSMDDFLRAENWGIPTFCDARRWHPGGIPVMMYHVVGRGRFERDLAYLRRNGYETIGLEDLLAWLRGEDPPLPQRPIALTFDDGKESLYSVAYPLLEDHGFRATAFICPWWADRATADRLGAQQGRQPTHANWDQLHEMDARGIIDVQSHTYSHALIWTSGRVVGFATPETVCPSVRWSEEAGPAALFSPPLGWPILTWGPRFADHRRFLPEADGPQACANHVADHGGAAFFRSHGWQETLRRILGLENGCNIVPGRYETDAERAADIRGELSIAKESLESRLHKEVVHLAFPWNEAGWLATRLAVEAGYRSACRGTVSGRDVCQRGDDPLFIPRADAGSGETSHILSLPGHGRRSLGRLIVGKAFRYLFRRLGG
jgi:hypothetical protein